MSTFLINVNFLNSSPQYQAAEFTKWKGEPSFRELKCDVSLFLSSCMPWEVGLQILKL